MISFYHLKLINYIDLSIETWYVIIASHLALFLGSITYYTASKSFDVPLSSTSNKKELPLIFYNDGKVLFWLATIFGLIGLFSAIQTWQVLLTMYNNVFEVLLHLGKIYQLRVDGEIKGVIPYLSVFSFASIFFSGLYSAYKKKIKLISFLPLISIIIKNIALASRASILFGFLEYIIVFVFGLYFITSIAKITIRERRQLKFQVVIVPLLFVLTIVAIKNLRGSVENFAGATRTMQKLQDSPFVSPSIYLYLSGHIGVLDKFLEKSNETARVGENSLQFAYNLLSNFGVVERPKGYQKPYFIPVWINTGTYIRELIVDFGFPGALIILFILGLITSFSWFHFYQRSKLNHLVILTFISLIFSISFLMMVTRLASWVLSLVFILVTIWIVEQILEKRKLDGKLNL